jgi:hypothetical protein
MPPLNVVQRPIVPAQHLPPDQPMDADTGGGGDLIVTVSLEDGQKIPVCLDTGSAVIALDKSLETHLGKPVAQTRVEQLGKIKSATIYHTPKLYLGKTPLMTGRLALVYDFSGDDVKGIIGMSCLKHYCIQLDFQDRKIRFLDPNHLDLSELGKAYLITFPRSGLVYIHHAGFAGGNTTNWLMDAGYGEERLSLSRELPLTFALIDTGWNPNDGCMDGKGRPLHLDQCVWDGQTYTNVTVERGSDGNLIGLKFLARHLVTFDFPDRIMYLKQTRLGPLGNDHDYEEAWKFFLKCVQEKGRLPGWSYHGWASMMQTRPTSDTFECVVQNKHGHSIYHYLIGRTWPNGPWQIQKAWQTDAKGRLIKEFPVP